MKKTYKIDVDCANCAIQLEEALQKIEVIENVNINFMIQKLTFECMEEDKEEALEKIKKIIKKEEPDVKLEEM